MDYSFNGEIARIYGVDEAVFIHNLYWWIAKNEANGRHYHDGRSWTYNSMRALSELFPFWTEKQIRRIIQKLEANGALHVGNYNQYPYDRTQWYALDESVLSVYRNGQIDLPKWANDIRPNGQMTSAQMGGPIPDIKPDNKPDNKKRAKKDTESIEEQTAAYTANPKLIDALSAYLEMRRQKKKPPTPYAYSLILRKLDRECAGTREKIAVLEQSIVNGWTDIYPLKEPLPPEPDISPPVELTPEMDTQRVILKPGEDFDWKELVD